MPLLPGGWSVLTVEAEVTNSLTCLTANKEALAVVRSVGVVVVRSMGVAIKALGKTASGSSEY